MMNQLNNRNFRVGIRYAPEFLLLIGGMFCLVGEWLETSSVNGVMGFGILVIVALLLCKNKYLALTISAILGLVSVFLMLATFAEYSEFPSGSSEGWQLLLVGMLIFGSLLVVSLIMPKKYFRRLS